MKKILAVLLVLTMLAGIISLAAVSVSASEASGTCGDNLTWSFDETSGTLTISGTGAMYDNNTVFNYDLYRYETPWFSYNSQITRVVIESGVTRLGVYAFNFCSEVTEIVIPDTVTEFGDAAFYGCSSLKSVTIPRSVTSIGETVFWGCESLSSLTVDPQNPRYDSRNNCNAIIDSASNVLIAGCNGTVIPEGVTRIENRAFYKFSSLTSVTIPEGVTSIGSSAFSDCAALSSVTIPDSVTGIGSHAFSDCAALTSVNFGKGVTDIGSYAFCDCTLLAEVNLPDSVRYMGNYAFQRTAFYTDASNWENGVLYSGKCLIKTDSNFSGSYSVREGTKVIAYSAFSGCGYLSGITIPDSVVTIGDFAFYNCKALTGVTVPNSVTSLGVSAFEGCKNLNSATVGNGVKRIEPDTFCDCSNLKNVTIGDGVTEICARAFQGTALYKNTAGWENGVLYIGNYLIKANSSVGGDYTVKDGTKVIACSAFYPCWGLGNVTIPDSVTHINYQAFLACNSMQSVVIGNGVKSIGGMAFNDCSALTNVVMGSGVTVIEADAFTDTALYTDASNWENGVLYIGDCLIKADTDISGDYTVKEGTRVIAERAFDGCSLLTGVILPDSVEVIDNNALCNLPALSGVYYYGTQEQWNAVDVGESNPYILNAGVTLLCKHEWNEGVSTASCDFAGTYIYTCLKCSETKAEGTSPALGHEKGESVVTPATCLEEGKTEYKCSRCGQIQNEWTTPLKALGHDYVDHEAKDATCTDIGWGAYQTCTRCNFSSKTVVSPLGHEKGEAIVTPATCLEDGKTEYKCARCGEIRGEWTTPENALGHDRVEHEAKEPTYLTVGWEAYETCSRCDYTTYVEIPATAKAGWNKDAGGWFYVNGDDTLAKNKWIKDSKGWCYCGSDGYIVYNKWVKDSKGWCYCGSDGYIVYNKWVKDSKGWCYCGGDGYMVYNKWVKDSKGWCYVGADGYQVFNTYAYDSKGQHYIGADGYMKW